MNGFLTRTLFALSVLTGTAFPVYAQNQDSSTAPARGASFMPEGNVFSYGKSEGVSGLAASTSAPPPAPAIPNAAPAAAVTTTASTPLIPDPAPAKIAAAPLPPISTETVGVAGADSLGADMWKGTGRATAEHLLDLVAPTASPVLNGLMQKLILTAATPPEGGGDDAPKKLMSLRIEKMAAFGSGEAAWSLATHADSKLVDDESFYLAAESVLTSASSDAMCAKIPEYAKTHLGADWQKLFIACQLRAKDLKGAQVSLDVFRAQKNRDNIFIDIANKIIADSKTLPSQLTPLSPESVSLLQIANLPISDEVFAHVDPALAPALLQAQARQDTARLNLAERALSRGLISEANIKAAYKATSFGADALTSPLTSTESGSRLRALLFQASAEEKDADKKIAIAVKFMQSASPAFLNNAGNLLAGMLGDIKTDAAHTTNAAHVAYIYMLADKRDLASDWLQSARNGMSADVSGTFLRLLPQFALAGIESDSNFATDFDAWFDAVTKNADAASLHDLVGASMVLMEVGGSKIPASAWNKILTAPHNEKRIAFSPLLSEMLNASSAEAKRAETVLLTLIAAGDDDISPPVALDIIRALRQAGFKNEAARFAQQQIALLGKAN